MPPAPPGQTRSAPSAIDAAEAERAPGEAAERLAEARALMNDPRRPGQRDRYRQLLDESIDLAGRAAIAAGGSSAASARSFATLAGAHAARAEDALHGASQLSQAAQRAPTPEACDDGWERAGEIAAFAEACAHAAAAAAASAFALASVAARKDGSARLGVAREAGRAAARASLAAREARRIVDERNRAYTFHTDYGFSFGEGWYLAAAAVLGGVDIQVEPGRPATAQAERFLRDAGLADSLHPYRPRPRANKSTTPIVARAFRADPVEAQRRLRAAFLGEEPVSSSVRGFVDARLGGPDGVRRGRPTVLVWIRDGVHHAARNSEAAEVAQLVERAIGAGLLPLLVGDPLRDAPPPGGAVDLIHFWKDPVFRGDDARRAQLQFFEHLRAIHGLIGQVGVTTAGMDGPALLGLPTLYLTARPNVRMGEWVGAVPGYEEVVRDGGHLDRIGQRLASWARSAPPPVEKRPA